MPAKHLTSTTLQIGISSFLILTAPFAMLFTPYEGIYDNGVWSAQFHLDPLNPLRASLIIVGLIAACLSVALLVRELAKAVNQIIEVSMVRNLVTKASATLCSLTIGWAAFPYWVNGVFQAFSGNPHVLEKATILDFDPKALMPDIWIGDIWELGVLLIFAVFLCLSPILFLLNLGCCIKTRAWKQGLATAACLAISAAVFFLSPKYWDWFFD